MNTHAVAWRARATPGDDCSQTNSTASASYTVHRLRIRPLTVCEQRSAPRGTSEVAEARAARERGEVRGIALICRPGFSR
eukprot:scaffold3035_cov111-Isochrysis_galbana.AAC.4